MVDNIELRKAVQHAKRKLNKRAERRGVWKDFGSKEIRRIRNHFDVRGNKEKVLIVQELIKWCNEQKSKGE